MDRERIDILIIRRLKLAFGLFLLVVTIGVFGYIIIEGVPFVSALYMTIITVTTVGYREAFPLSTTGLYFTMFIALAGIGTAFYLLISVAEFLVEGHLTGFLVVRRIENTIKNLHNHYILCGYGRIGEHVAEEFSSSGKPFVVIDNNPERVRECFDKGYLCIEGDAASDEILTRAGVDRAQGLVTALDDDADNVFVTLSARVLNPRIIIVARAVLEESREKLMRAGANKVVLPSLLGGKRMAALLLRPVVSDYLDVVTYGDSLEFSLKELLVSDDSVIKGKTLAEADIRKKTGALVLAIRKKTGELNTIPTPKTILAEGDRIVVLGTREQLEAIHKLV